MCRIDLLGSFLGVSLGITTVRTELSDKKLERTSNKYLTVVSAGNGTENET